MRTRPCGDTSMLGWIEGRISKGGWEEVRGKGEQGKSGPGSQEKGEQLIFNRSSKMRAGWNTGALVPIVWWAWGRPESEHSPHEELIGGEEGEKLCCEVQWFEDWRMWRQICLFISKFGNDHGSGYIWRIQKWKTKRFQTAGFFLHVFLFLFVCFLVQEVQKEKSGLELLPRGLEKGCA